MTHKRQAVRDAIVARIDAGVPALSGRVHPSRSRPAEVSELPLAMIHTLNETSEVLSVGGRLRRRLTTQIEVRAQVASDLGADMDFYCSAIESAMAADRTFGRVAMNSALTSTTIGLDGDGEARQALAILTYEVDYQTDAAGT